MQTLTLQTLIDGRWESAAALEFPAPERGAAGECNFEYLFDYLKAHLLAPSPYAAVSLRLPVEFKPICARRWPAFLDDLRPMGGARRFWLRRLNLRDEPASDWELLRRGTGAPIGNVRVLESVPERRGPPPRFPRAAVIEREHAFLEHAADAGAQVGGATGAGGESPKLLVRQGEDETVWIDAWQDDPAIPDRHYLVKFARSHGDRDRTILRSEYVYYRALARLGVHTISEEGMALEEGPNGPSLWLPRFDTPRDGERTLRWGVESVYSLAGSEPGAYLTHQAALQALREVVTDQSSRELTLEYLRRDLLNLVFGNSDNHGRNTAVLRKQDRVSLAPIYDFAPMRMDLDGITRTTRWAEYEAGGEVDWARLLASFGADEAFLREGLRPLAERLRDLFPLLESLGLPEETLNFPGLGLRQTEQKLRAWTLL